MKEQCLPGRKAGGGTSTGYDKEIWLVSFADIISVLGTGVM